ncbi:MAG: hypothetical protein ABL917_03250 [Parcubacteria group bacterium]
MGIEDYNPEPVIPNESEGKPDELKNSETLSEAEKETAINGATTPDELYEVINKIGVVHGTSLDYKPSELIHVISSVLEGTMDLSKVTRTYNLRNVVEKFMNQREDDKGYN